MLTFEFISAVVGFLLTLMVFSYLIGDNLFFRFAVYLFVGVSAGYAASVAFYQVILGHLITPLFDPTNAGRVLLIVPLLLSALLVLRLIPGLKSLGTPAVAYLVGVGAAVAVGGSVLGTLFPQIMSAIEPFGSFQNILTGMVLLVATTLTLVYFHYGAHRTPDGAVKRNVFVEALSWGGRLFVGITLGALFAGVYSAALTALIERIHSIFLFVGSFF